MDALQLLAHIRRLGGQVTAEGGRLRVNGPKGMLTPELQAQIAGCKAEILALLATVVAGAPREKAPGPPPVRLPRSDRLPLSFAQQRLWFLHQFDATSESYNVSQAFRLRGELDVDALGAAFTRLAERHETLRTTFVAEDGTPYQRIGPVRPVRLVAEEPPTLPGESPLAAAERAAENELGRVFALDRQSPLRVRLWRLADDEHLLLVALHHIATDGWSLGLLKRDLASLYGAAVRGGAAELPELPLQYADFAGWQRGSLQGPELDRLLAYWRERLAGIAPLELPLDRPRPPRPSHCGALEEVHLDASLAEALEQLSRRTGGTLFMTMLAAFSVLLQRYTRQDDIAVGTPIGNRGRPEFENLVGCFLNMLVLRTDVSGDPTFLELVERVRAVAMGAYRHQALPFEKLVEEIVSERDPSINPLFQVFFAVQNAPARPMEFPGLSVSELELPRRHTNFDLDVHILPAESGLRVVFLYGTDLFEAATIRAMGRAFRTLLTAMVERPEQHLSSFVLLESASLLDPGDTPAVAGQARVESVDSVESVESVESTEPAPFAAACCLHELIAAQVARTPDAVAVLHEGRAVTYAELDSRARRLAARLAAAGVGTDVPVGLCVERGPDMLVGLLAILHAGGAYLPLDPALPAERLSYMLQDCAAPVLVTQERLLPMLPAFAGTVVCLDAAPGTTSSTASGTAARMSAGTAPGPESLAYVIYTSGSTGKPKGVEVTHRSVVNFLQSMRLTPGLRAADTLLAVTTLSFDIAGLELLLPLCVGARVVIASKDAASDGHRLRGLLESSGCTVMQATPATWQMLLDAGWAGDGRLKMLCGGEALVRALANRLLERGGALWNMYGPTETTIWSAVSRVEPGAEPVTIGQPIANTQLLVLDEQRRAVPQGVPGELFIAGAGLARGYRHRPELTAERFVASPRPDEVPGRLYRTGDKVRRDARGRLCFLGRLDDQVKLRGFRIELGEIEAVLAQHPDVRQAAALVIGDTAADQRLVAFWVPRAESRPEAAVLREFLRRQLPDYMLPGAFVELQVLPLSPAGKLDRKRLAAIGLAAPAADVDLSTRVLPRSPVEEAVAGAFRDVLRLDGVGVHDDFFRLGGHSLLATRLVSRLRGLFGVELPLSEVFETPTVAGLAQRVEQRRRDAPRPAPPAIVPVPRTDLLPLSFAQSRLWLIDQMGGGEGYHIRMEVGLAGRLDTAALERALAAIVARHETLRTRFAIEAGAPHQVIEAARPLSLRRIDLSSLGAEEQARALRQFSAEEAARPFDLAHGPLFRFALVKTGYDAHVLSLSFHHIVADGWSFEILRREIAAHYRAFANTGAVSGAQGGVQSGVQSGVHSGIQSGVQVGAVGGAQGGAVGGAVAGAAELPALPVQYADFAAWQRGWMSAAALKPQLDYWKQQLSGGVAALELPTDRPRPPVQSFAGAAHGLVLDRSLSDGLAALAREQNATMAMVCLAAFQALLARWSGQQEFVLGSPIANRTQAEVEGLIGFFVNSLVMRADVSADPKFTELLGQARAALLAAYDHQDLPFEQLVEAIAPVRDPSRTPIFQVVFAMHQLGEVELEAAGVRMRLQSPDVAVTRFDLELHLFEGAAGLQATLVYSTALFDAATIERLAGHYETLLKGVVERPEARVSQLPLLDAQEWQAVVLDGNATEREIPGTGCIHHLIEDQARVRPAATAAVHHDSSLTYAQLNARANQVARELRSMGVQRDTLVGLCVRRGVDMLVGMLGILKAGAAYVPLDPAYPADRLAFMLKDAELSLLVTESALSAVLPPHDARVLCLDADRARLDLLPDHDLGLETSPDDLAYAIFTSGSTGTPKAALLRHRGLCNVSHEQARAFGVQPGTRVLQFSSLSFDASTFDIVMALPRGATLFLGDRDELMPGPDLLDFLRRHAIEIVTLPPTALSAMPAEALPALKVITVAGEACPPELVARWAPGRRFFNLYGPTEATIWSTMAELKAGDPVHIGRPIANTRIYLLDGYLNPVPVGVPGEICIGGAGIARGYFNRPRLTAERFIEHPLARGGRLYRTGDLGRRHADGQLEFLGRIDHQVKLRGYRIELGEIESVLGAHPSVKQVVAMVREDVPGDRRLVAYVVGDPDAGASQAGAGQADVGRAAWEQEQVSQWQALYEESYGEAETPEDRTFNISAWDSSYTNAPIPAAEMREWLDRTVEGILQTRPQRVLELGCGMGLLLFRIAPHCEEYLGTDFSRAALDYVERNLGALAPGSAPSVAPQSAPGSTPVSAPRSALRSAQARVEQRSAHDLSGIPEGHYDTIVLNSVVQYFPSIEYLARVLQDAVRLLRPGGRIFVGDVRSLPLLRAFHASVQLYQSNGEQDVARTRQRVNQLMSQDQELVIHPEFFVALRDHVPAIRQVSIEPKRGHHDNELDRFRYDVVLSLEAAPAPRPEPRWLEWGQAGLNLDALRELLRRGEHALLGVRGIPNRRTARDASAAALLFMDDAPATVAQALSALDSLQGVPDPDDLRDLCRELPYACAVTWAGGRADGGCDAVFRRRAGTDPCLAPLAADPAPLARPRAWSEYANQPLRGRALRELVPRLRSHAAEKLPEYMLPSAFVVLEALPVTPNGKVNRAALPAPDALRPELAGSFQAPRSRVETILAEVWMRTLNLQRVGIRDNFFELGGDSILCIHVVARAREAGVHFSAKDLFQHPTVAELALVARASSATQAEQGTVTGALPLTPIQQWFLDQDPADPQHFNQSLLLRPAVAPDAAHLRVALRQLVAHHDALRLRFRREPDGWKQELGPLPDEVALEVHDLSGVAPAERGRFIEREAGRLQASFDLSSGVLLAAALFRGAGGEPDALLLVAHHLAVDAVSWSPLLADLQRAMEQLARGSAVQFPPKTSSFLAWSRALSLHAQSPAVAAQAEHWLTLPSRDVRALPTDFSTDDNTVAAAKAVRGSLSEEQTSALLHELPASLGCDINSVLLAALARSFGPWTGQQLLLLDLEGHGREELAAELDVTRTVGWFTSMHPVLLRFDPVADRVHTLRDIHRQLAGYPGRGLPWGLARHLAQDARLVAALAALPVPQVAFNYLGQLDQTMGSESAFALVDAPIGPSRSLRSRRAHLLEINAGVMGGRLFMNWTYASEVHAEQTIKRLAQSFVAELEGLLAASARAPGARLEAADVTATAAARAEFGWDADDVDDLMREVRDRD